jgi:hypothetical protein
MRRPVFILALLLAVSSTATAADLSKIDRSIKKEPAYATKTPSYGLLVLGPDAADRVWLVKDGKVLYVDRNGNGDLTEPDKKIVAKRGSAEDGYSFEVDTLTVNGKTHYRLSLYFMPLEKMMVREYARRADAKAILAKDPQTEMLAVLRLDVTAPHIKLKGTVATMAGGFDLNGPLVLANKPAQAPIIHMVGPLEITFNERRPDLRRNRDTEVTLLVGTPGLGAGTFAAIGYDETIPASVHPRCEVTFPPAKPGAPPIKTLFVLKERC